MMEVLEYLSDEPTREGILESRFGRNSSRWPAAHELHRDDSRGRLLGTDRRCEAAVCRYLFCWLAAVDFLRLGFRKWSCHRNPGPFASPEAACCFAHHLCLNRSGCRIRRYTYRLACDRSGRWILDDLFGGVQRG